MHYSLLYFRSLSSYWLAQFPVNSVEKQLATFQKSSVHIKKMYQPKGRRKLHSAVFKRVLHIQKVLVPNGRELTNSIIKEGVF